MVCKFVRKIAKEKVIAKRNEASSIAAAELDFPGSVDVTHFVFKPFNSRNYSTRVTSLKETILLNSAGQKNGVVYLRKSEKFSGCNIEIYHGFARNQ